MTSMAPSPNRLTKGLISAPLNPAEVVVFRIVDVLFMLRPLATPGAEDEVVLAAEAATTAG